MRKVVIITGGSRGIGAATARAAAHEGYAVCVNYRDSGGEAEELVSSLLAGGAEAAAVRADVGDPDDVRRLFDEAEARWGPVTALVNNAGVLDRQSRLADMSLERVRRIFETNVFGTFLTCREAVRRMSTDAGGGGGVIVNVSSIASVTGSPREYVDYAASKGAVDSLTVGLAREVATQGIRVNAVRPGAIHTTIHSSGGEPDRVRRVAELVPMRRGGRPEEVAEAILWLLSPRSSYVTGAIVDVAGGV